MTVYVVTKEYDDGSMLIESIFSSLESAQARMRTIERNRTMEYQVRIETCPVQD